MVLKQIESVDPTHPTKDPVPYTGVQFVAIPEFQSIGTTVGQNIAGALSGQETIDAALKTSEAAALTAMKKGGYIK